MAAAVRFEHVTKRYRRGGTHRASLRGEMKEFGRRVAGFVRRRPVQNIGTLALDDVSFEIEAGSSYALVGPNGAGKTTALRMITRISPPTEGRVTIRGRVGALMEVGTGLHGELSGRENIWLYGSILGISRREIAKRFDQILGFAELGDVIDTQVKYYSSGMALRLGFSIAAHLEPEILVVDEALAVGDASFQARCVERMSDLHEAGTTLLYVSHQLQSVETVCENALFLLDGRVQFEGATRDVLEKYLRWVDDHQQSIVTSDYQSDGIIDLQAVTYHDRRGEQRTVFDEGEDIEVRLHLMVREPLDSPLVSLGIRGSRPWLITACSMYNDGVETGLLEGPVTIACKLKDVPLRAQLYTLMVAVHTPGLPAALIDWQPASTFRIERDGQPNEDLGPMQVTATWPVAIPYEWSIERGVER